MMLYGPETGLNRASRKKLSRLEWSSRGGFITMTKRESRVFFSRRQDHFRSNLFGHTRGLNVIFEEPYPWTGRQRRRLHLQRT